MILIQSLTNLITKNYSSSHFEYSYSKLSYSYFINSLVFFSDLNCNNSTRSSDVFSLFLGMAEKDLIIIKIKNSC
jgi:hypothetical protein